MKRQLVRSAVFLTAILLVLGIATTYNLTKLYRTAYQLAESNRKAFVLDAKNKQTILVKYFQQRAKDLAGFSADQVFQTYFTAKSLSLPNMGALRVTAGSLEQKLLVKRLAIEEHGKPVYSRMAFYDIAQNKVIARTDFSPKGRWIDGSLFRSLLPKAASAVNVDAACQPAGCRIFLFGPVVHEGHKKGILLMELDVGTIQDQIQLLSLQKPDSFSGLVDSDGTLILGPHDLAGRRFQDLFGFDVSVLKENPYAVRTTRLASPEDSAVAINGSSIDPTGFYLVQVAPRSRFVRGHSPILWTIVFLSLLGGLVLVFIHVFSSYSERIAMYEKLQDAHDHLEMRVSERTAELREVNKRLLDEISERKTAEEALRLAGKELEAVNRDLRDFAYVVSHDLKAPLRSIRQLIEWIAEDYSDILDVKGKKYVGKLVGSAALMSNLIEGILQYSKVGRAKEEKSDVDLNELVSDVIGLLAPPSSIKIHVRNPLPTVHCRVTLVHEVFQNLLDNAIKYMDKPNGEIGIQCFMEDTCWKFAISDNGPGIDERYHEKIFEIFSSLSVNGGADSTGIGLALVKKIVEIEGGTIWVESPDGLGTTFFFTLPRKDVVDVQAEMH
jgi:signal transduction histidine kinase